MTSKAKLVSIAPDGFIDECSSSEVNTQMKIAWEVNRYVSLCLTIEEHLELQRLKWLAKQQYLSKLTIDVMNRTGYEVDKIMNKHET